MKNSFYSTLFIFLLVFSSCGDEFIDKNMPNFPSKEDTDKPAELVDGFNYSVEVLNADLPLTIMYKAGTSSPLNGYEGDVYLHTGVIVEGVWQFVPADWNQNLEKCKFTKKATGIWSITLSPSIREWYGSGTTPVEKLGMIVRSSEGDKQTPDTFIAVEDNQYTGFIPGEIKNQAIPAGVRHGINIVDNSTVTLVMYDKDVNGNHKDYAYVVGDFNGWRLSNTEESQMYRDEEAGCWWITLDNLDADKEYAFQYYVGTAAEGSMRLADAYCEKILDKEMDKYIPASTYPENERVYPEGGIGIVSVFKIRKDNFAWTPFEVKDAGNLIIYEMLFRDFTESGDINGAMAKLDYLKDLGVTAIELMPVQEFDGNDSWGYNPCFYFAMDKAYGTKKMYKEFIDACHQRGMAVILDVVYNHATGNHPFAKLYWDGTANKTASNNPWFNVDAPHPFSVFHDFNHNSPLVREFVKRSLKFMLEEYHVDGFRFDLTKGFTQTRSDESSASNYDADRVAVLKDYNDAILQVKPNAVVILEHFCDSENLDLTAAGMHVWRNLNHAFCQSGMGWQEGSGFSGLYANGDNVAFGGYVGYLESHDEQRVGYKMKAYGNGDIKENMNTFMSSLVANAAFCFTVPGPKMVWQFGEMGYDVSINYPKGDDDDSQKTSRKPLHWEYETERATLVDSYRKLIAMRTSNPELFVENAAFSWEVDAGNWDNGRYLTISTTTKHLVVTGNFTPEAKEYTVDFPVAGKWYNYLTGDEVEINGSTRKMKVPAHTALVFTTFK